LLTNTKIVSAVHLIQETTTEKRNSSFIRVYSPTNPINKTDDVMESQDFGALSLEHEMKAQHEREICREREGKMR
jgi:hypothetical protein